jgi:hypothetical protein
MNINIQWVVSRLFQQLADFRYQLSPETKGVENVPILSWDQISLGRSAERTSKRRFFTDVRLVAEPAPEN